MNWLLGLASSPRAWSWAGAAIAVLALAFAGWTVKGWADKAARVDKAEAALADEIADRAKADLARLAASGDFRVTVQIVEEKTNILMREVVKYVPDDRPCLPKGAVDALNKNRQ